jgi:hypothetical protein
LDDRAKDKKRRRQKGVDAIFSSQEEPENIEVPTVAPVKRRDGFSASLKMVVSVLSSFTFLFLYWMISSYEQDIYFRNYVSFTFSRIIQPIMLLAIGSTGLGFCIAWVMTNYIHDHRGQKSNVGKIPE